MIDVRKAVESDACVIAPLRAAFWSDQISKGSIDHPGDWKAIGPYVSERAWGTVREDYSADGDAWNYFPHEHARSRLLDPSRGAMIDTAPIADAFAYQGERVRWSMKLCNIAFLKSDTIIA